MIWFSRRHPCVKTDLVMGVPIQHNVFIPIQPFAWDATFGAGLKQLIGLDNWLGLFRVLDAGDESQPRFLSHGVDENLLTSQLIDDPCSPVKIGAGQAARLI